MVRPVRRSVRCMPLLRPGTNTLRQPCSGRRRGIQLREIRRRYRRSDAGRAAHRDQERRRRERKREALAASLPAESVGDHRSQTAAPKATVAPQTRVPTVPASSISASASKPADALLKCHRCSRSGISSRLWGGEIASVRANECECDTGRLSDFNGLCVPSTTESLLRSVRRQLTR